MLAMNLGINHSLRGLSVVNEKTVWVSGTRGCYLYTTDGGENWNVDSVQGAEMLDFRSVQAFSRDCAILVSAGTPARIYKTSDGGKSWTMPWSDENPAIFLDAVAFWDKENGIIMGDPVDGRLFLLISNDGGDSWQRIPSEAIPEALPVEGGFAASGTCLVVEGRQNAWIGTGGDSARVYHTQDLGKSWSVVNTPILSGGQMKGIYTLAFKDNLNGIAAGGEWNVKNPLNSRAYTSDGGKTWRPGSEVDSFCSGSCFVKDNIYLVCGQSGTDISDDGGETWQNISQQELYGIKFTKNGEVGFGTGPKGRVVKLKLVE